ncbi:MAG: DUF4468 domain-containing protein [Dysgonomonas sp.]
MNRYFLILLCTIVSVFANAQDDNSKYLAGAIPEIDGRVVFTKTIEPKRAVSDTDLYELMLKWANTNYAESQDEELLRRVLLANSEERDIACYGEDFFTFRRNAFILDRAKITYQLIIDIKEGKCEVAIRNIKFDYQSESKGTPAEEMISDRIALNKSKDKLNRYYDKFRIRTVDSVNSIFNSIDVYLNGKPTVAAVSTPGAVEAMTAGKTETQVASDGQLAGYKRITIDKIPEKLLNSWTVITSGQSNQPDVMTALWGGTGSFGDNKVAFSILNPERHKTDVIDNGDTYTISFYTDIYSDALKAIETRDGKSADKIKKSELTPLKTPSGAVAFSEAWMIIECKKGTMQPSTTGSITDSDSSGLSKEGYNKTYIGEIINVWVK